MTKITSYDLFGLLVDWKTGNFDGVVALLGSKLYDAEDIGLEQAFLKNFCLYRKQAEELARTTYTGFGCDEISLKQIYQALCMNGGITEKIASTIMDMELSIWKENLCLIKKEVEKMKSKIQAGYKVIVLADSVVGADYLRPWLMQLDPVFGQVDIYVSADYRKKSSSGNLFNAVREELGRKDFKDWQHRAVKKENFHIWMRRSGMQIEVVLKEADMELEQCLLAKHAFNYTAQQYLGIARRMLQEEDSISYGTLAGISFGGPLLTSYVKWILQESMRSGIRRLYFIARDGYLPMQMADVMIKAWHLPIETHYLYGSRKAWRMPGYDGTEIMLRHIILYSEVYDMQSLANALNIEESLLLQYFPWMGEYVDNSFSASLRLLITDIICRNEKFRKELKKVHEARRMNVVAYLRQEVDVSDEAFAFVDMNGTGFTQQTLARLMQEFYSHPIKAFYFALYRMWPENKYCRYFVFVPGLMLKNSVLLEVMTRTFHGQTKGYEVRSGKYAPVIDAAETLLEAGGYQYYINGCLKFCYSFAEEFRLEMELDLSLIADYVDTLIKMPESSIFTFFADLPFNATGREKDAGQYAPRLSKQDIRNIYLFHRSGIRMSYYKGYDLELSRLRCKVQEQHRIVLYQQRHDELCKRFSSIWHKELDSVGTPYDWLFQEEMAAVLGPRVVLYGAGKYGQRVYEYLRQLPRIQMVGWLDKEWQSKQNSGLAVMGSLQSLKEMEYDVVIIGVSKREFINEIREMLRDMGIPEERVLYLYKYLYYGSFNFDILEDA